MILGVIFSVLLSVVVARQDFSYTAQDEWSGICNAGNTMQQSPVDIVTDAVQENKNLIDLQLTNWNDTYDGEFLNNGHTVQFNLENLETLGSGLASTRNHLGIYYVLQFHMHWGNRTGQGSEHRVDGEQAELEIHFVQVKVGETDNSAADYLSVIGVLADVDEDAPIEGVWAQLNAAAIQPFNENITVEDFRLDQLLPENLDYWYYEGSLTTQPCSEIVAWFMLQNRITVPGAYLDTLRQVQQDDGSILSFNFRMKQDIADRTVYKSPASGSPKIHAQPIIILALLLVMI